MDVLYFLKERTRLIREYYEHAAQPFNEIIRKIEAEEEPYIPPYSEDPEPAFFREWIEADELLEVTGRYCISMLSASLHLYFKTWEHELRLTCGADFKGSFDRKGWVHGYLRCFAEPGSASREHHDGSSDARQERPAALSAAVLHGRTRGRAVSRER